MPQKASATVTLNDQDFIEIVVKGDVKGDTVQDAAQKTKKLIDLQDKKGKKSLLLIDLSEVTDEDSTARLAAKDFLLMPFSKCAIYGANSKLSRTVVYLIKSVGLFTRVRYFNSRRKAVNWLRQSKPNHTVSRRRSYSYLPAIFMFTLALFWYVLFSPFLSRLPDDYSLNAQVASYDNLWDANASKFSGETKSETQFTYKTLKSNAYVSKILATFDVRKPSGDQIFVVNRTYGINRLTLAHVSEMADKKRDGYLFAPKHLNKQPFVYWHVNYDTPINMKFEAEDTLFGVKTYRYTGDIHTDQTGELKKLLKLNDNEGINLDGEIKLWVDPVSGYMVKYSDQATAYYYNKANGERLHPWNRFRNELTEGSIRQQANSVREKQLRISLYENVIPVTFLVISVLFFVFFNLGFSRTLGVTYVATLLVIVVGFFTSYQVWQFINTTANTQAQVKFDQEASSTRSSITNNLNDVIHVLNAGAGLFRASDKVQKQEWTNFTSQLQLPENFAGLQGVGYAAYVTSDQKTSFLDMAHNEINPNYAITPASDKNTYVPVAYLEPSNERNQNAIGYDMYSDATRRDAIDLAILSGNPAMTGRVTLVQETDQDVQPGFLIYVPIYGKLNPNNSLERQKDITGFAYAPFRARNFISNSTALSDPAINVEIFDTNDASKADDRTRLFGSPANIKKNLITQDTVITIAGRPWLYRFSASMDAFTDVSQRIYGYIILLGGCMLSLMLSVVLYLLLVSRRQAVDLASRITEDLSVERNTALANQQKDDAMLSSIGEGLIVINDKGNIERINSAALQILGYSPKHLLGKKLHDVVPAFNDQGEKIEAKDRPSLQVLNERKAVSVNMNYRRKNGTKVPVAVNIAPIFLENKFLGAIEVFRDLTKERELDRAKTEFVSLASHQLRTPLTAIGWYSEMLMAGEGGKLSKEQRMYLEEIEDGNRRMVDLVGSLLDVSRIEAGIFKVEPVSSDVTELAKNVIKDLEPEIFRRKQELVEEFEDNLPEMKLDPQLSRMIFENLLSNASKYTKSGGKIVLRVYHLHSKLRIEVSDNGYGIPAKQQSLIFKKLFRADNVYTLDTGGTGLGLYIIKSIIDQTGGKIWFESKENKGTTFYVELPLSGMKPKKGSKRLGEKTPTN